MRYDNKRTHTLAEWIRFYYERIIPVPKTLVPAGGYPEGVDVSRWNTSFDPDLSAHKIDFAFQKLTEGTTWIDPKIEEIWTGVAKVAVRGGYHYIRSGQSWTAQVNHFMSVFNRHDYHVAIVDLESNNGDNVLNDTLYADTRRWIDSVRSQTGKRVLLYTSGSIWILFKSAIKRLYADGQAWLDELDFWYAWPSLSATEPPVPCKVWQYRWDGKNYGTLSVNCDVNRFIGTLQELYIWAGADGTPPPPPPTGDKMYECIKDVAIRDGSAYYGTNKVDVLYVGDKVDAVVIDTPADPIPKWLKFSMITRKAGGVTIFSNPVYCSANVAYVKEVVDAPPSGSRIASIFKSEDIVITYEDQSTETFRAENIEFTKVV